MTAPMTVAEIAVRLAAAQIAGGGGYHVSEPALWAEELHAELVKRGHIAPDPAPVAGPDWLQAPQWAQWAAQDEDDAWWWYERKPVLGECAWRTEVGGAQQVSQPFPWRESIQRRPGGG